MSVPENTYVVTLFFPATGARPETCSVSVYVRAKNPPLAIAIAAQTRTVVGRASDVLVREGSESGAVVLGSLEHGFVLPTRWVP